MLAKLQLQEWSVLEPRTMTACGKASSWKADGSDPNAFMQKRTENLNFLQLGQTL